MPTKERANAIDGAADTIAELFEHSEAVNELIQELEEREQWWADLLRRQMAGPASAIDRINQNNLDDVSRN